MLVSLGVGYQKLVSSTEMNQAAVTETRAAVAKVEEASKVVDTIRANDIKVMQQDVAQLKIDIAVSVVNTKNISDKITELNLKVDQVVRQTR